MSQKFQEKLKISKRYFQYIAMVSLINISLKFKMEKSCDKISVQKVPLSGQLRKPLLTVITTQSNPPSSDFLHDKLQRSLEKFKRAHTSLQSIQTPTYSTQRSRNSMQAGESTFLQSACLKSGIPIPKKTVVASNGKENLPPKVNSIVKGLDRAVPANFLFLCIGLVHAHGYGIASFCFRVSKQYYCPDVPRHAQHQDLMEF